VLLVANCATLFWVWRLEQRFHVPINVSGGHAYVRPDTLLGISHIDARLLPETDPQGRWLLAVSFSMLSRTPGSQIAALYRTGDGGSWQLVNALQPEPLEFTATVPIVPGTDLISYRVAELVRDEIIRATPPTGFPLGEFVAGRLYFTFVPNWQGTSLGRFYFEGNAHLASPVSVEKVAVRVVRPSSSDETHALTNASDFSFQTNPAGIDRLEVTVRYRDGQERQAVLRPPWDQVRNPIVER
jgi:hypothetical protein